MENQQYIEMLNKTISQLELLDIYRTIYAKIADYFNCTWNTYQERPQFGSKKKIPYKFRRIHAIQSMSLDHNRTKLGIDSRNTYRNSPRHMHESKRKQKAN